MVDHAATPLRRARRGRPTGPVHRGRHPVCRARRRPSARRAPAPPDDRHVRPLQHGRDPARGAVDDPGRAERRGGGVLDRVGGGTGAPLRGAGAGRAGARHRVGTARRGAGPGAHRRVARVGGPGAGTPRSPRRRPGRGGVDRCPEHDPRSVDRAGDLLGRRSRAARRLALRRADPGARGAGRRGPLAQRGRAGPARRAGRPPAARHRSWRGRGGRRPDGHHARASSAPQPPPAPSHRARRRPRSGDRSCSRPAGDPARGASTGGPGLRPRLDG